MIDSWEDDLIKALSELAILEDGEGLTTREYAKMKGLTYIVADRRIRDLWEQGKIECYQKMVKCRAGYSKHVPAYRLK